MLAAIGGKVDKKRRKAFEKMCGVIVRHIQQNAVVTGIVTSGTGSGGTVVASKALPPGGGIQ
jgi:ribose 5-phosphate isomerase RpiB